MFVTTYELDDCFFSLYAVGAGADHVCGCDSDAFMVELATAVTETHGTGHSCGSDAFMMELATTVAETHGTGYSQAQARTKAAVVNKRSSGRGSNKKTTPLKDSLLKQPQLTILHTDSKGLQLDGSTSLRNR